MTHDPSNTPFYEGLEYPNPKVRDALERAYTQRGTETGRVRIWYGDTETGRAWQEEYDVLGYVSRSGGTQKIPLLIFNRRSIGGGAVLTQKVVRIDWTDGSGSLYKHPTFSSGFDMGRVTETGSANPHWRSNPWSVVNDDGEYVATFTTKRLAERWLGFMRGDRYSK